jgi:hypothetical protein
MKTLLLLCLLALVGCETTSEGNHSSDKISRETPVFIVLDTNDVLYPAGVLGEGGMEGLARRVRKYLVAYLGDHGVKITDTSSDTQPKLIVRIDTVETKVTSAMGAFSPIVKQDLRMKFNTKLNSGSGGVLFRSDSDESDESVDVLARKVAEKAGSKALRYFK